ncbi:MAG TPA: hypothetical protein PLF81_29215, partial [Candidatus Anammoximicrobium sp.]|nr:hypothetical protein [Candidatus Anammoximicrobium sp.]
TARSSGSETFLRSFLQPRPQLRLDLTGYRKFGVLTRLPLGKTGFPTQVVVDGVMDPCIHGFRPETISGRKSDKADAKSIVNAPVLTLN